MATKSKKTIKNKEKIVQPVIEKIETVEKVPIKKTIKKPTLSIKTIKKEELVESSVPVSETVSPSGNDIKTPKKKRTLKLALESSKTVTIENATPVVEEIVVENKEEIKEKVVKEEVTINQNSAFFNEPSIFAKFNIDITETEKKYDIISDEVNVSLNVTDTKPVSEEKEIIDLQSPAEYVSAEEAHIQNIVSEIVSELNTEEIEVEEENENIDINFEDILDSDLAGEASNDIVATDNNDDTSSHNNIIDISELIAQDNDVSNDDSDDSVEFNEQPVEEKIAADAIGKFFDSSVPHLGSDKTEFTTIKRSNISPIFKNFSFDETASTDDNNPEFENIAILKQDENNINNIQKTLENFTPNTINETALENSAAPTTLAIPVIETDVAFPVNSSDLSGSEGINDYSNIITPLSDSSYNNDEEDDFSVEDYFGISDNDVEDNETEATTENINEEIIETKNEEISNLTKLLEQYSETISDLSDRISSLENTNSNADVEDNQLVEPELELSVEDLGIEDLSLISDDLNIDELDINPEDLNIDDLEINPEDINLDDLDIDTEDLNLDNLEINPNDLNLDDLDINPEDLDLDDLEVTSEELKLDNVDINPEDINLDDLDLSDINLDDIDNLGKEANKELEELGSILSEALSSKETALKDELLTEVLSYEENDADLEENLLEEALQKNSEEPETSVSDSISDFSKIIDSLSKAITELEQAPEMKPEIENIEAVQENQITEIPSNTKGSSEKAINILINKNDVFSISIQNETYEIVADFDGISVLSENIRLSTPKNNFFVTVGNKYIEIFNKKNHFVLNTNFEDIEFTNAINNITFAKKNNKIELIIKEAFKLSSVNNKIELSMLNKAIADFSNTSTPSNTNVDENSICDNKTLLISEETQKVYLPYTIEEVMKKLKASSEYQTVQEVVENEYTVPLSTFKMPIISRFKEAYRFMRVKEKSSVYAAMDLALELMFNSNLNPAVIRAAKDLKELNIYLDCLYENEIEKFDCFKIVYKVLPKIK